MNRNLVAISTIAPVDASQGGGGNCDDAGDEAGTVPAWSLVVALLLELAVALAVSYYMHRHYKVRREEDREDAMYTRNLGTPGTQSALPSSGRDGQATLRRNVLDLDDYTENGGSSDSNNNSNSNIGNDGTVVHNQMYRLNARTDAPDTDAHRYRTQDEAEDDILEGAGINLEEFDPSTQPKVLAPYVPLPVAFDVV